MGMNNTDFIIMSLTKKDILLNYQENLDVLYLITCPYLLQSHDNSCIL